MFSERNCDQYILSSSCPFSCSVVAFALRIGGVLDPQFLLQCQIADKKLQKVIDGLKQIPLKYESSSSTLGYQEELFLDMDVSCNKKFYDSWDFRQHNSWLRDPNQYSMMYTWNEDILL